MTDSPVPSPSSTTGRRKKRTNLLEFYGAAQKNAGHTPIKLVGTLDLSSLATTALPDMDSLFKASQEKFEPEAFLSDILRSQSLDELIETDSNLVKEIERLQTIRDKLVHANYKEFITVSSTIREMQITFDNLDDDFKQFIDGMDCIAAKTKEVTRAVLILHDKIVHLVRIHDRFRYLKNLVCMPSILDHLIQTKQYHHAIKYYLKTKKSIEKYQHLPSIVSIYTKCQRVIEDLIETLKSVFYSPDAASNELNEYGHFLIELGQEDEQMITTMMIHYKDTRVKQLTKFLRSYYFFNKSSPIAKDAQQPHDNPSHFIENETMKSGQHTYNHVPSISPQFANHYLRQFGIDYTYLVNDEDIMDEAMTISPAQIIHIFQQLKQNFLPLFCDFCAIFGQYYLFRRNISVEEQLDAILHFDQSVHTLVEEYCHLIQFLLIHCSPIFEEQPPSPLFTDEVPAPNPIHSTSPQPVETDHESQSNEQDLPSVTRQYPPMHPKNESVEDEGLQGDTVPSPAQGVEDHSLSPIHKDYPYSLFHHEATLASKYNSKGLCSAIIESTDSSIPNFNHIVDIVRMYQNQLDTILANYWNQVLMPSIDYQNLSSIKSNTILSDTSSYIQMFVSLLVKLHFYHIKSKLSHLIEDEMADQVSALYLDFSQSLSMKVADITNTYSHQSTKNIQGRTDSTLPKVPLLSLKEQLCKQLVSPLCADCFKTMIQVYEIYVPKFGGLSSSSWLQETLQVHLNDFFHWFTSLFLTQVQDSFLVSYDHTPEEGLSFFAKRNNPILTPSINHHDDYDMENDVRHCLKQNIDDAFDPSSLSKSPPRSSSILSTHHLLGERINYNLNQHSYLRTLMAPVMLDTLKKRAIPSIIASLYHVLCQIDDDYSLSNSNLDGGPFLNSKEQLDNLIRETIFVLVREVGMHFGLMLRKIFDIFDWLECPEPIQVNQALDWMMEEMEVIGKMITTVYESGNDKESQTSNYRDGHITMKMDDHNPFEANKDNHNVLPLVKKIYIIQHPESSNLHHFSYNVSNPSDRNQSLNACSILTMITKYCLRVLREIIVLKTLSTFGYQQLQIDMQYLSIRLTNFCGQSQLLQFMISDILSDGRERCINPIPIPSHIINAFCSEALKRQVK